MKPKKCKVCKEQYEPQRQLQQVSSPLCGIKYTQKQKEKAWKKEKAQKKKELMSLSDWLKIAQSNFNKFIRARDEGLPCISCDNPNMKKINASHYYNANNHYNVRFNEDNVHSSCEYCNTHLSGNLIEYRPRLIKKIGAARFYCLESIARVTRKFTIDEVKEINEIYKQKIKDLKK